MIKHIYRFDSPFGEVVARYEIDGGEAYCLDCYPGEAFEFADSQRRRDEAVADLAACIADRKQDELEDR